MLKEMHPAFKKIYDEAMAIELPAYIPGGANTEADAFLKLRNQFERLAESNKFTYEDARENHAEHYKFVNMRTDIDKKLKDYMAESRKIVDAAK
jgi:uncharacterized protein (DUF1697 family)